MKNKKCVIEDCSNLAWTKSFCKKHAVDQYHAKERLKRYLRGKNRNSSKP